MFGRSPRRGNPEELVADAELVLAGRYADHLLEHRRPVPAWAWTNLLSHACAEDLHHARIAHMSRAVGPSAVWLSARAYLAGEVLDAAARHGSLDQLQAEALVPVELALMTDAKADHDEPAPSEWVSAVLSALAKHRSTSNGV